MAELWSSVTHYDLTGHSQLSESFSFKLIRIDWYVPGEM
jgi:hypothetical protein